MSQPFLRTSISTSKFSKSYLAKAWDSRNELLDYERRGFAQFFYLTLCGHIESELARIITRRLYFIRKMIPWESLPPMKLAEGEDEECEHAFDPLVQSIQHMARHLESEVESAPLMRLIDFFGRVFTEKLREVVGSEQYEDMIALAALRNIFAHGRDLTMDFEGEDWSTIRGTLEGNPLKFPAARLHRAGIIKELDIDKTNYHAFQAHFYSDEAMLYFYGAAQRIENMIDAFAPFLPERSISTISKLPRLGAEE